MSALKKDPSAFKTKRGEETSFVVSVDAHGSSIKICVASAWLHEEGFADIISDTTFFEHALDWRPRKGWIW